MEILVSVTAKVAEYTVVPMGRGLGYIFFYTKNMKDLEEQLQNLVNTRDRVQRMVDDARNNNAYQIEHDVLAWLAHVDDVMSKQPNMSHPTESRLNEKGSNPSCFNMIQRHRLSRKAKKMVNVISEIIEKRKMFENVGYPVPLPGIISSSIPGYQTLESRMLVAKKIKDALADPNVNKVGVYGMAGVGKTMMLYEVDKLAMEEKLFDIVIKVTIGQTLSVESIQDQIGDKLRMELNQKVGTKEGKAALLRNKLEMENNVLIMLDDLWKELDLLDVGIPCRSRMGQKGCKILITSRSRDVLTNDMDVEDYFHVNPLSEEEYWKFFVAITGEFDNSVEHVAKEVAKECGGLPIVLSVVAKALKGKDLRSWKDALKQLKNPVAVNIKGVSEKVYSSLKLSYDDLNGEAQLLFLLCSVFPDDYQIFVEDIQMYAMGMRLLDEVDTWEEARNRVIKLVGDLKSSSLLLESNLGDEYAQMHDVVRDVAIYIASKEGNIPTLNCGYKLGEWQENGRSGSYRAIFGDCDGFDSLPQNLEFQKLELLVLRRELTTKKLQISNTFFEGMKELRVLELKNMCFQQLSTSLTHSLENLRMLYIYDCKVDDIDAISQLKKLEILKIHGCPITILPATMGELIELKVLQLSDCIHLEVIPKKVISSMKKLEEVDLTSFKRWGEEVLYKNKLVKNVALSELYLLHLTHLKLDIVDDNRLPELLFIENLKLETFYICVGGFCLTSTTHVCELNLVIKSQSDLIDRVLKILLPRCERLTVRASVGITNLLFRSNQHGHQGLSQENANDVIPFFDDEVVFPELRHLTILEGNNLKMLWHNNWLIANSFSKLQKIYIYNCNSLRYIFSSNVVNVLTSLNTLTICDCELVEGVFEMEKPKLKNDAKIVPLINLILSGLPKLKYVWSKDHSSEFLTFPNIKGVKIFNCPWLTSVFPASFIKDIQRLENLSLNDQLCQIVLEDKTSNSEFPKIVFPNLRSLSCRLAMTEMFWFRSETFPTLRRLAFVHSFHYDIITLPSKMTPFLYNIEEFVVKTSRLVQVFPNDKENNDIHRCANLKSFTLIDLRELTHVWKDNTDVTILFNNLETFSIVMCDKLERLVPPSTTFLNLRHLSVDYCCKLINLLSFSVSKSLVKLELIKIRNCQGMTSILEEGEAEEEEEKDEIVFRKLAHLIVDNLPRLRRFYPGICTVRFPSLKILVINQCPKMKVFSHGIIHMPMLQDLTIERDKVPLSPSSCINSIIHDIWLEEDSICSIKHLFVQEDEEEEEDEEKDYE